VRHFCSNRNNAVAFITESARKWFQFATSKTVLIIIVKKKKFTMGYT